MRNGVYLLLLNLHSRDLRVPVGSLSRFKLCLPQCNVPDVLNLHVGSFKAGFLACIDDIISYENYKY